jgi:hypothetical protein
MPSPTGWLAGLDSFNRIVGPLGGRPWARSERALANYGPELLEYAVNSRA